MKVKRLKRLEIKLMDGDFKVFENEPLLVYDNGLSSFIITFPQNDVEGFIFPSNNISYIKTEYETTEEKAILRPDMGVLSKLETVH